MKEGPLFLHVNIHLPGITSPETLESCQAAITYSWLAMAIIIGLALVARFSLKKTAPTGVQNLLEVIVGGLNNFIEEIMGPEGKHYLSLIGSLFLFILVCNLQGLVPGFDSPTANINTTLALALVAFTATHYIGMKRHGIGYVKHFMGPMWGLAPLMLPIELISHFARVMSLTFRLFGNMVAKHKLLSRSGASCTVYRAGTDPRPRPPGRLCAGRRVHALDHALSVGLDRGSASGRRPPLKFMTPENEFLPRRDSSGGFTPVISG